LVIFGSSPSNGTAGIRIKYLGSAKLDLGDRHFSPDGSCYNLCTENEQQKAFSYSMNIALAALTGPLAEGLGDVGASIGSTYLPKVINTALKVVVKKPVAANAINTAGKNTMVYLAQKTFQANVLAAGAGIAEGSVKSYFGGPDTELGSSIFVNPISEGWMNATGAAWATFSLPTYP